MIKQWFVTGDTHGNMRRFKKFQNKTDIGIIILGDVGCNYYLGAKDFQTKKELQKCSGCTFYCVRGNHEERPENIRSMGVVYDAEVHNCVYVEDAFPNIKYFVDGFTYIINNHKTLVIGGAYSVDKWYRLMNHAKWFKDEQLTQDEMNEIENDIVGSTFDFVLTHTCPFEWQPTDLFLHGVDQNTVDNSMEKWFSKIKDEIHWKVWLFGHYHVDRTQLPCVEILFEQITDLNEIWYKWKDTNY